ncbi:hypothetical protein VCUG_01194 [Vavraia culicis subsp. floridensis]|uniref:Uncharacterized protein n=1 Tax=Vavraia culicis (isolate floridensis) TaxID=948595 RepID=L2GW27_VAVCU|nr:uncharacterized protein VCUG_01194 [Vavraia culicis subsp. floridensis]ELA47310.1 hypothetical protein VCUG_01194 [Vavraia culicis subsp. floridensis]
MRFIQPLHNALLYDVCTHSTNHFYHIFAIKYFNSSTTVHSQLRTHQFNSSVTCQRTKKIRISYLSEKRSKLNKKANKSTYSSGNVPYTASNTLPTTLNVHSTIQQAYLTVC